MGGERAINMQRKPAQYKDKLGRKLESNCCITLWSCEEKIANPMKEMCVCATFLQYLLE